MAKYIYQSEQWPHFTWEQNSIQIILGEVRHFQGKIAGQMNALGFSLREETSLDMLTTFKRKLPEEEVLIMRWL